MNFREYLLVLAIWTAIAATLFSADASWHYSDRNYRIPITVDAGMYERKDCIVSAQIDFKKVLHELGVNSIPDPDSIRVTEYLTDANAEKEVSFNCKSLFSTLSWRIDGNMESMTTKNFYVYFDVPASGRKYSPAPAMQLEGVGINLLENSSFENVSDGKTPPWQIISTEKAGTISTTDETAHSGKYSICISKEENKYSKMYGYKGWTSDIPVKPNTKYMISAWVKAEGKGRQVIQLSTIDKNKKSSVYVMAQGIAAHDWQLVSKILTTNEDSCFAEVKFFLAADATGNAYFDDISLVELPENPEPEITINKTEINKNK